MKVPKKFNKAKKSFVNRLAKSGTDGHLSSFFAFPSDVSFNGLEQDESVILLVRQHPAVFIPQYLLILGLLLAPLLMWALFSQIGGFGIGLSLGVGLVFLLIAITVAMDTYLKWFYSVNIVTDEKIVDVDFFSVLSHRFSEAQLEKIEDVSHAPVGLLSSIFDYGDVYIQTAATKPEFDFNGVPKPRDIQDTLLDLLEMKQKNQI